MRAGSRVRRGGSRDHRASVGSQLVGHGAQTLIIAARASRGTVRGDDPSVARPAEASLYRYSNSGAWEGESPLHRAASHDARELHRAARRLGAAHRLDAHVVDGVEQLLGIRLGGGLVLVESNAGRVPTPQRSRERLSPGHSAPAGSTCTRGVCRPAYRGYGRLIAPRVSLVGAPLRVWDEPRATDGRLTVHSICARFRFVRTKLLWTADTSLISAVRSFDGYIDRAMNLLTASDVPDVWFAQLGSGSSRG